MPELSHCSLEEVASMPTDSKVHHGLDGRKQPIIVGEIGGCWDPPDSPLAGHLVAKPGSSRKFLPRKNLHDFGSLSCFPRTYLHAYIYIYTHTHPGLRALSYPGLACTALRCASRLSMRKWWSASVMGVLHPASELPFLGMSVGCDYAGWHYSNC